MRPHAGDFSNILGLPGHIAIILQDTEVKPTSALLDQDPIKPSKPAMLVLLLLP